MPPHSVVDILINASPILCAEMRYTLDISLTVVIYSVTLSIWLVNEFFSENKLRVGGSSKLQ